MVYRKPFVYTNCKYGTWSECAKFNPCLTFGPELWYNGCMTKSIWVIEGRNTETGQAAGCTALTELKTDFYPSALDEAAAKSTAKRFNKGSDIWEYKAVEYTRVEPSHTEEAPKVTPEYDRYQMLDKTLGDLLDYCVSYRLLSTLWKTEASEEGLDKAREILRKFAEEFPREKPEAPAKISQPSRRRTLVLVDYSLDD